MRLSQILEDGAHIDCVPPSLSLRRRRNGRGFIVLATLAVLLTLALTFGGPRDWPVSTDFRTLDDMPLLNKGQDQADRPKRLGAGVAPLHPAPAFSAKGGGR